MLSILIPTYNYETTTLVQSLYNECIRLNIAFEIIVRDDALANNKYQKQNETINTLKNCSYKVNSRTLYRAANRNTLAENAQYENLLFIDGDARVENTQFVQHYLPFFHKNTVVIGGTKYIESQLNEDNSLRWHYGFHKEMKSAAQRNVKPYHSFTPFNVLIPKHIFQKIKFDENLKEYGHEDTLFGWQLQLHKIPLIHIQNPLIHEGLESNEVFLNKSEKAIQNLIQLEQISVYAAMLENLDLVRFARRFQMFNFSIFKNNLQNLFANYLKRKSYSKSMFIFSFWKMLMYYKHKP